MIFSTPCRIDDYSVDENGVRLKGEWRLSFANVVSERRDETWPAGHSGDALVFLLPPEAAPQVEGEIIIDRPPAHRPYRPYRIVEVSPVGRRRTVYYRVRAT